MIRVFLVIALLLGALFLGGAPTAAQAAPATQAAGACDGGEGIYLYDLPNYGGACVKITEDVPDLSAISFNNIASSVRVVGSWVAELYVDQEYSNVFSAFAADDDNLANNTVGDNRASSVVARRGTVENLCDDREGVYLYDELNYRGRCVKITGDVDDLSDIGFNNIAASIRLVGDWVVDLYVDQNYSNVSSPFTQSDADLRDNVVGVDSASSIRVRRSGVPAEFQCDGGGGVYVYEHPNHQGSCLKFQQYVPDLRNLGFDDVASSIRFLGGWTATLYRDLSGTGIASTFSDDDPNLNDDAIGDNQATSISVQPSGVPPGNACDGGEGAYLYEHPDYQGRCVRFTSDAPDLRNFGFDDIASSVRFVGGWTATLYRDLSGTGVAQTFTRDDPNLIDDGVGDNQATSVRVGRAGAPATNDCDGGEGVYVYEHPNYQGRCVKFTSDAPDLRVYGFDDIASSIQIVGNWSATLYRDLSGTGIASTFAQSDPNLNDDPVGDNHVTSIGAVRVGSFN